MSERPDTARLPPELLQSIVSYCDHSTLCRVAVVSRAVHEIAIRRLYRRIDVDFRPPPSAPADVRQQWRGLQLQVGEKHRDLIELLHIKSACDTLYYNDDLFFGLRNLRTITVDTRRSPCYPAVGLELSAGSGCRRDRMDSRWTPEHKVNIVTLYVGQDVDSGIWRILWHHLRSGGEAVFIVPIEDARSSSFFDLYLPVKDNHVVLILQGIEKLAEGADIEIFVKGITLIAPDVQSLVVAVSAQHLTAFRHQVAVELFSLKPSVRDGMDISFVDVRSLVNRDWAVVFDGQDPHEWF